MKTKVIMLFSVLFAWSHLANAQQRTVSDLAGRWESEDGTTGSMEFIEGNKVVVSISGMQVPAASYSIDFSQDPIWFDVFVSPGKAVKGLLKFIDDDTMKWQLFLDGDRPLDFSDNGPVAPIVLKRKK